MPECKGAAIVGMAAALDVLGYLPGPPTRYNCGAADTLAGETFAYGVASAVAVLDVRTCAMPCLQVHSPQVLRPSPVR